VAHREYYVGSDALRRGKKQAAWRKPSGIYYEAAVMGIVAACCCAWLERGAGLCHSDSDIVERQDFALVSQEVRPVRNDSLGNAIKVLHLVGFEILQDLFQPINKSAFLLSLVYVCRAELCNDSRV
jgi:hypothetical protein